MEFLSEGFRAVFLVLHIIAVMIAVGAVTVTDYFHLIGLRKKSLEKRMLFIYPKLGNMILFSTAFIVLTGLILLINKPEVLNNPLVQLKLILFGVVLINGFVLHTHVYPHVIKCVLNEKGACPLHVLWISSISGSISVVTWYGILILALTKGFEYSVQDYIMYYLFALILVFLVAFYNEEKARIWDD
jgi:hypothetical protein